MKTKSNSSESLPMKVLLLSYITHHQTTSTIRDCHSAINHRLQKMSASIQQNYREIASIFGQQNIKNDLNNRQLTKMQVIQQQQYGITQRQDNLHQPHNKMSQMVNKFNKSIGIVEKASSKLQDIMYMYKNQLKDIAKELTKEKQLTKKLTKQLSEKSLKDTTRSTSANRLNKPTTVTTQLMRQSYTPTLTGKAKINRNTKQQLQSQDEQARQPPKPFCEECLARQRQTQKQQQKQIEQKNKWKLLSSQITNLKDQLLRYEEQLVSKQTEINKFNQDIKKFKQDGTKLQSQQKKKIRTMNTTLRGEKIMLENQLQNLRKKNQQFEETYAIIEGQNKKLKLQKDNLQSTIKWHENTIQDLRKNFSLGLKEQGEIMKKCTQLEKERKVLYEQIEGQQKYLQNFVQKLQEIEKNHAETVTKLQQKVSQLQNIIDQKNQTIVKLKIDKRQQNSSIAANRSINFAEKQRQSSFCPSLKDTLIPQRRQDLVYGTIMNKTLRKQSLGQNVGFQENMIKVLNKKIVDRDEVIQKLQRQIKMLRDELDVYKDE